MRKFNVKIIFKEEEQYTPWIFFINNLINVNESFEKSVGRNAW